MSIDRDTVVKVAKLARLDVSQEEMDRFAPQLEKIFSWIEQLNTLDTSGVEPLDNVVDIPCALREDTVTDGGIQNDILSCAPEHKEGYFVVPKVVE